MNLIKRSNSSKGSLPGIVNSEGSSNASEESKRDNCNKTQYNLIAGTALDNIVVLMEIFGYLSPADLRTCCAVNETWQSIADPMILDYQLHWRDTYEVEVTITKGYIDPKIEMRKSSMGAESDYLLNLTKIGRAPFIEMIWNIDLQIPYLDSRLPHQLAGVSYWRQFFPLFGSLTYKLTYVGEDSARVFFSSGTNNGDYNNGKVRISSRNFPHLENLELLTDGVDEFAWPEENLWLDFPLVHLKRFYFGLGTKLTHSSAAVAKILRIMPNVKKIHGAPTTFVEDFLNIGKLHVLRSVGFYKHSSKEKEDEGMKSLVEAKLKFRFLMIGRTTDWYIEELKFLERNKKNFEDLLELGKDSLEHLIIRALQPERLINYPCEMPGIKHITLRGRGFSKCNLYFKEEDHLLKRFPNVDTISFMDFTASAWSKSKILVSAGGLFRSKKLRQQIKFLKSTEQLEYKIELTLLRKFPGVKTIEIVTMDRYGGYNIADGIISL